jgi:hypothetical protein
MSQIALRDIRSKRQKQSHRVEGLYLPCRPELESQIKIPIHFQITVELTT